MSSLFLMLYAVFRDIGMHQVPFQTVYSRPHYKKKTNCADKDPLEIIMLPIALRISRMQATIDTSADTVLLYKPDGKNEHAAFLIKKS